jgi:serine protease
MVIQMKRLFLLVLVLVFPVKESFCMISFNANPGTGDIYFSDLFTDSEPGATWYKLKTMSGSGVEDAVDTSALNVYGKGWIEAKDLGLLRVDFAQADDTVLKVGRWDDTTREITWSSGLVDFSSAAGGDITTQVDGDTPFHEMFNDWNVASGTWYQLWIGSADGTSGEYADTTAYYSGGKGWIRAEDLHRIIFPAPGDGNTVDLWVRVFTKESGYFEWEHWSITQPDDGKYTLNGTISAAANMAIDSDVNDPNAPYAPNNTAAQAQVLGTPVTLGGYVNRPKTGNPGASYISGDINDVFRVELLAGDYIILNIAELFRTDLDIYLYDADTMTLVDSSVSVTDTEVIEVTRSGSYLIQVQARRKASNYTLTIGQINTSNRSSGLKLSDRFIPGEIIVKMKEEKGSMKLNQSEMLGNLRLRLKAGGTGRSRLLVMEENPAMKITGSGVSGNSSAQTGPLSDAVITVEQSAKLFTLNKIARLRDREDVEMAEPNYVRTAMLVPDDEYYSYQWHYPLIHLPEAWDVSTGSSNVIVAVVDTGVFMDHPDITGQITGGYDFISSISLSLDGDGIDPNADDPGDQSQGGSSFHGTHVSGTISAKTDNSSGVAGISWKSRIMPLRVLGKDGVGTSYDILQSVRYAAGLENDSGKVPDQTADIINLSLGGGSYSNSENTLFSQIRDSGIIVVAAAGNSASSQPSYPAAYDGVVSVSAVGFYARLAPYSNFGSTVDVAAPGGDYSTDLNGDGYVDGVLSLSADDATGDTQPVYTFYQGTSMAAPHVAGIAALMKAVRPSLTAEEFDGLLESGAIVQDIGSPGRDDLYGYGLIDAEKAVIAAMDSSEITVLSTAPSSLSMGTTDRTAELILSKIGEGPLSITSISETADWLEISPDQVDEDGLGTYVITVDRDGLKEGIYKAAIDIDSTENSAVVTVEMRVNSAVLVPDAGLQYILLVNRDTGEVVDTLFTSGEDGIYNYQFNEVLQGNYHIFAGTDSNNDGYIGDTGEAFGAYISTDQVTAVDVASDRPDLNFFTEFGVDILELETLSTMEALKIIKQKTLAESRLPR